MAKAIPALVKKGPARIPPSRAGDHEGKFTGEYEIIPDPRTREKNRPPVTAREPRAPVQILRSTKEWLDQIIAERYMDLR